MQSVTAIICRKRDATVGDTGKGGGAKKREEMGKKRKSDYTKAGRQKERGMA